MLPHQVIVDFERLHEAVLLREDGMGDVCTRPLAIQGNVNTGPASIDKKATFFSGGDR